MRITLNRTLKVASLPEVTNISSYFQSGAIFGGTASWNFLSGASNEAGIKVEPLDRQMSAPRATKRRQARKQKHVGR